MTETRAKRKKSLEYAFVVGIVLLAGAAVSAYGFYQREIAVYVQYQAWQSGPYRSLVDRLYYAAAAGDTAGVAGCVDPRAAPVVHDKSGAPAIQYGGGMRTETITLKALADRGPFRVRRLQVETIEPGGVLIHATDRSGTPLGFMVRRSPRGALRITTLVTQHLEE